MKATITIEVNTYSLDGYTDEYLAQLWHIAQANPAPHGDRDAGDLVEGIGREIIRRFLATTRPSLWHHQGRDHFWNALTAHCIWNGQQWVPKVASTDDSRPNDGGAA